MQEKLVCSPHTASKFYKRIFFCLLQQRSAVACNSEIAEPIKELKKLLWNSPGAEPGLGGVAARSGFLPPCHGLIPSLLALPEVP